MNRLEFLKRFWLGAASVIVAPRLIASNDLKDETNKAISENEAPIEIHSMQRDWLFTAQNYSDHSKEIAVYVHHGEKEVFNGIELSSLTSLHNSIVFIDTYHEYKNITDVFFLAHNLRPEMTSFNETSISRRFILRQGDRIIIKLDPKQKIVGKLIK